VVLKGVQKGGWLGGSGMGDAGFCGPFFFFGYISNVVVEGVCVRHCMGPRVYKVGTAC
jgi:hypothetical protein